MLTIQDLHCEYATGRVLRGVHLDIGRDEMVAVLGRNGTGKTTLVRSIMAMRPPIVTRGQIRYREAELSTLESYEIARLGIGLVPQGRRIFASLSVDENLAVTARPTNASTSVWNADRVYEFFPGLAKRTKTLGRQLSGGEQQMLAIGRALVGNPAFLIMDEASEGLAPGILRDIREGLCRLKEEGITALIVEQNIPLALALADRVYVLGAHGGVAWSGTTQDFEADDNIRRRHLGV